MNLGRPFLRVQFLLAALAWAGGAAGEPAQIPQAMVMTAALIHWWPDPWVTVDQVTGHRGIRRGFGPIDPASDARFGHVAGWVELGAGITNRTFTLACWVRASTNTLRSSVGGVMLSQGSGTVQSWMIFQGPDDETVQFSGRGFVRSWSDPVRWDLPKRWHYLALRVDGPAVEVLLDGQSVVAGRWQLTEPLLSGPICVGNSTLGSSPWDGDVRDLRVYGRWLDEAEIMRLASMGPGEMSGMEAGQTNVGGAGRGLPRSTTSSESLSFVAIPPVTVSSTTVTPRLVGTEEYWVSHFTTDNGLPSSEIQCLAQARSGEMWIGTKEGLARFNGRTFRNDEDPPLMEIGSDITALAEDATGSLWQGRFGGLASFHFDRKRIGPFDRTFTFNNLGLAGYVRRVVPAKDGILWLAISSGEPPYRATQLRRFDPRTGESRVTTMIPGQVRDLRLAMDGLWIATEQPAALWHFIEATSALEMIVQLSGKLAPTLMTNEQLKPLVRVSAVAAPLGLQTKMWQEPNESLLWVQVGLGTNGPVLSWSLVQGLEWSFSELATGTILSEWVATPRGLLRNHAGQWERLEFGTGRNSQKITSLIPHLESGVWASTQEDGLWLIRPRLVQVLTRQEGLGDDDVQSVVRAQNGDLLACGAFTVTRIDPSFLRPPIVKTFEQAASLVAELTDGSLLRIHSEAGTNAFSIYRGTNAVSYSLCSGADKVPEQLIDVSQFHAAADGSIWVVAKRGLYQVRRLPEPHHGEVSVTLYPPDFSIWLDQLPAHVSLVGLVAAPDGAIWVGSSGAGLFRLINKQIESFPNHDLVPDIPCVPLGFKPDGTLWLSTEDGLSVWHDGKYSKGNSVRGLPVPVVYGIEEAGDFIWCALSRDVYASKREDLDAYFDGRTQRVNSFYLGSSDGLPSKGVQHQRHPVMAKSDDEQLWVATRQGLVHFLPREVLASLHSPKVRIETFGCLGDWSDGARTNYVLHREQRQRQVTFWLSSPGAVMFRYSLIGPGGDGPAGIGYKETTDSSVTITALRPGRHAFTVVARSRNGLVSDPPARVEFDVEQYFHEMPAVIAAAGVCVLALIAGFVTVRLRQARRTAALEQEQRLNTERQRIARDMHDDLGATLTRLAWQAGRLETSSSASDSVGIAASVRNVLRSLDERVWAVNPAKDRLDSVVNYLDSWVCNHFRETSINLAVNLPAHVPELPVSAEWRHHVFLMVKEACSNVLKHSSATEVWFDVSLGESPGTLKIALRDNGTGFIVLSGLQSQPPKSKAKLGGNGLDNLSRRATELGAQLSIESAPDRGTTVRIAVPIPASTLP